MELINPIRFVKLIEPCEYVISFTRYELRDLKRNSSLALRLGEPSGGRQMNKIKNQQNKWW